jgi:LysM repeat protein
MPTGTPTRLATSSPARSPAIGATPVTTVVPTTGPTAPPTAGPSLGSEYTVTAGDTLWDLAQWYGVAVHALLAVNPQIADGSLIRVGDRIVIPPSNTTGAALLPGRVFTIDFSRAEKLSAFDPRFFEQEGIVFPPRWCQVDVCSDWFVGWIQGDDALVGGPISATFTRPISSLSVRAAPGAQGTAEYTLTAFDRGGEVIAMKSVVVAQYIADPQVTLLGYFVVELDLLSKPARRFTFEQKDLALPAGMSGIGYGLDEISFTALR